MGRPAMVLALALVAACAHGGGSDKPSDAAPDTSKPIDAAIDGNGCAMQPCTILPQCGCTGATACDVDVSDGMGTACRSVLTPGTETSTCTSLDKCDKGYVCLGGTAYSTCKKYCLVNTDCGTPRGRCAIDISSGGTPVAGIPSACSSNCSPLSTSPPAECPAGFKCGLFIATHNSTQVPITDCSPAGAGTQGASCGPAPGNDSMCATGYLCTTVGTTTACRRVCNKTANTGCTGTQTCLGFATPQTVDIEYGVCN